MNLDAVVVEFPHIDVPSNSSNLYGIIEGLPIREISSTPLSTISISDLESRNFFFGELYQDVGIVILRFLCQQIPNRSEILRIGIYKLEDDKFTPYSSLTNWEIPQELSSDLRRFIRLPRKFSSIREVQEMFSAPSPFTPTSHPAYFFVSDSLASSMDDLPFPSSTFHSSTSSSSSSSSFSSLPQSHPSSMIQITRKSIKANKKSSRSKSTLSPSSFSSPSQHISPSPSPFKRSQLLSFRSSPLSNSQSTSSSSTLIHSPLNLSPLDSISSCLSSSSSSSPSPSSSSSHSSVELPIDSPLHLYSSSSSNFLSYSDLYPSSFPQEYTSTLSPSPFPPPSLLPPPNSISSSSSSSFRPISNSSSSFLSSTSITETKKTSFQNNNNNNNNNNNKRKSNRNNHMKISKESKSIPTHHSQSPSPSPSPVPLFSLVSSDPQPFITLNHK